MPERREVEGDNVQHGDQLEERRESAEQSKTGKQAGPEEKATVPNDPAGNDLGESVITVGDLGKEAVPIGREEPAEELLAEEEAEPTEVEAAGTEEVPDPAAQRVPLFSSDGGTEVYAVKTAYQRYLPVTALVVPLGSNGDTYSGFARTLERELPRWAWRWLSAELGRFSEEPIWWDTPVLISMDVNDLPDILPNAPAERPEEAYGLIAATAAGADRPEDLREAAAAIVRTAHEAGVTELGVLPLGVSRGLFKDRPAEVASQMVHGIWAALLDLPDSPLREITFATQDEDAFEAAYRKSNLLTRNVPQKIWGDQPADEDLLGIKHEAEALAESLLLRDVLPPLAVGILGGWGSGKSTVMRLMMKRMTRARIARVKNGWRYDDPNDAPTRVGHIYQIRFNAWTYAKSNLWASLMQTIFWELNRQLTIEQRLLALKEAEGKTALDGGKEFQFLYDPFARLDGELWGRLSLEVRAALQDDGERNVLWQQLRAKHRHALQTLQKKEKQIAHLKAQREEIEVRRRAAIMHKLGQESKVVAYRLLRRRARALLGDVYERVMTEADYEGKKVLASELRNALQEIAHIEVELEAGIDEVSPRIEGTSPVSATLGDLPGKARAAVEASRGKEPEEQVVLLKQALRDIHDECRKIYLQEALTASPVEKPLPAPLEEIQRQAARALALEDTEARVEALYAEARGLRIVGQKMWEAGGQRPKWAIPVFVIGLILVVIAAFFFFRAGMSAALLPAFAGAIPFVGSLVTLLRPPLKVVADWGGRVGELVGDYQQEAEAERQRRQNLVESRLAEARAEDEKELEAYLALEGVAFSDETPDVAGRSRRPLPYNLAHIDQKIEQLEAQAEELRRETGPPAEFESLLDFVQARQDDEFYEKQLGLMHQVKRDIDVLTGGLAAQPEDDPAVEKAKQELFPRGPARVVLYIDDLDRCPPNRVVEVLEAVQLLLNTELFVVVLGLDTRYITRALEKEYREILQPDGDPSGLDYIEKILQLPYRVRPIDENSLDRFLAAQMVLVSTNGASVESSGEDAGDDGSDEHAADEEGGPAAGQDGGGDGPEGGPPALPELPPEVIKFETDDLDDLKMCCRQLSLTPRNVKRLVNVLKLINVFWFRTGGDLRGRPIKRTVVALLALSAGYPEIMREAFVRMTTKYRDESEAETVVVGQFLSDLSLEDDLRKSFPSLNARFHADITFLYRKEESGQSEVSEDAFLNVTLAELELATFNLVRSFSFVGDPVYLAEADSRPPAEFPPPL